MVLGSHCIIVHFEDDMEGAYISAGQDLREGAVGATSAASSSQTPACPQTLFFVE